MAHTTHTNPAIARNYKVGSIARTDRRISDACPNSCVSMLLLSRLRKLWRPQVPSKNSKLEIRLTHYG